MPTVGDWFKTAKNELSSSSYFEDDAELTLKFLLESRLKRHTPFLSNDSLSEKEKSQLDIDLSELCLGKPLPYVIGEWSFYGYDFCLTPDVLIPRPETEFLIEEAIHWLKQTTVDSPRVVYDVGAGSGIIGITIAKRYRDCKVIASDISPEAVAVCEKNIQQHNISHRVTVLLADGLPKTEEKIDLLCANLPYIPEKIVDDLRVSDFEPRLALDGGPDGLRVVEQVLLESFPRMKKQSLLLFEIEAGQKQSAQKLAQEIFQNSTISVLKDLAGKDRLLRIEKK